MHGLINRSIQSFLTETYGEHTWRSVAEAAGVGEDGFEAMLHYDDALTTAVIACAADKLNKPVEMLLEDLGTFLVSHSKLERLRRLLRFGGETFVDFLDSLNDLHGRARLAVPDLEVPEFEVEDYGDGAFKVRCHLHVPGASHVMVGILRAMADDYGALILLDYLEPAAGGQGVVSIDLLDSMFAAGRDFQLAETAG